MSSDDRENLLSAESLAGLNPHQRKARLGEALLPLVQRHQPILAVHVMKALLELEDGELFALLENDACLERKIEDLTAELARQDETKRRGSLNLGE